MSKVPNTYLTLEWRNTGVILYRYIFLVLHLIIISNLRSIFSASFSVLPPSEIGVPPQDLINAPPISAPTLVEPLPSTSASTARHRAEHGTTSPLPLLSPTTSTPRRRRLLRARTRRVQTPFERATSEFVAVENRRLELEEERERNSHKREMERLRIEERRMQMEENRNTTLCQLTSVLVRLSEILPQLKPSSLPSTDTL